MIRTLGPGSDGTGLGHLAGAPGVEGGKCSLSGSAALLKLLQQKNLVPQQTKCGHSCESCRGHEEARRWKGQVCHSNLQRSPWTAPRFS